MLQSFETHPYQFQFSAVNFRINISEKETKKTIFHFIIFQMKLFPFSVYPSGWAGGLVSDKHTHVNRET